MYAVVLAGGGGTRLWPLSRPECPKPFLHLLGDETLIQRTVARLAPLVAPEDVYVVAERGHMRLVAEQLPAIPAANLLAEPIGRNTAAAVALAAEAVARPEDEVMLVLPADAYVADEAGFRAALAVAGVVASAGAVATAGAAARGGPLVTLGVTPNRPETGYGYVLAKLPARQVDGRSVFNVERFVEKPTAEKAEELIATGLASWNAGIFAWTRATIRDRLARHAPEILGPIRAICASGTLQDLEAAYPSIRATSIDYAVMEPASVEGGVAVVPMDVGWSDLGSWAALRDVWQAAAVAATPPGASAAPSVAPGAVGWGNRRDLGSTNTLVLAGDRLVVTIGLDDTIVVDTPEALLICSAERSQEVRGIAQELMSSSLAPAPREDKP
ncbi:MAG: mannose-1-phosphate guanylyltransferase [Candidatus Limnocylindrales bacterium]